MKTIQVDMFAVGLGASVLTQFALKSGGTVTVLADGGMGVGYSPDTVQKNLPDALKNFAYREHPRIDLIVGTHYDGDHLKGLVPIIDDKSISIGEVWLPPVRNDTEELPGTLEADDFLAELFFDDDESIGILKGTVNLNQERNEISHQHKMSPRFVTNQLMIGSTQIASFHAANLDFITAW